MNENYILFSVNGLLVDSSFTPISKGNNGVDVFYFNFAEHNYNETYVTIAVTLPDGTSLPEISTSSTDFEFKNVKYKGFKLKVLEPLTSQAGVLTLTVNLKSINDDRVLCSSRLNVTIYDSDTSTDPVITDAQYQQMLISIKENYDTLNENKINSDYSDYAETIYPNDSDLILINRDGVIKKTKLENTYNIESVNNVEPIDKKITLDSSNIPYDSTNVYSQLKTIESNLEEKATKIDVNTKVGHRTGTFESTDEYEVKTGILPTNTDTIVDVFDFARIVLTDTNFIDGDILTCDLALEFVTVEGNSSSVVSFTRVLNEGTFFQHVITGDGKGNIVDLTLYGIVSEHIISLRVDNLKGYSAIKPKINFAIVRRY